jgi:hypothetical protein
MPNPMRDYFEERERTLEKHIAELEAALCLTEWENTGQ